MEITIRLDKRAMSRAFLIILAAGTAVLMIMALLTVWGWRMLLRDAVVGIVADRRAGGPIPMEPDYSNDNLVNDWGMWSNSHYILLRARHYLPFFAYEGIVSDEGVMIPPAIVFWPGASGSESFHLLGRASCARSGAIRLNERMLYDRRYADARVIDSTLVHEMIHDQGGIFCSGVGDELEAYTQAATVEVLAASCNYGDKISCAAFWLEIRDAALSSLRARLMEMNAENVYQAFADVFIRSPEQRTWAHKALRWWNSDEERHETLVGIVTRYGARPWREHILMGVLFDKTVDTGTGRMVSPAPGYLVYYASSGKLRWDDTKLLLGWLVHWLWYMTPYQGW